MKQNIIFLVTCLLINVSSVSSSELVDYRVMQIQAAEKRLERLEYMQQIKPSLELQAQIQATQNRLQNLRVARAST